MGHLRLGRLPATRQWHKVVALLGEGADVAALAAATAHASETEFNRAKGDPALAYTVWLLTQLPLAAKSDQFAAKLGALGFDPGAANSLIDLVAGFSAAVDRQVAGRSGRTDLGEMARLAAAETIAAVVGSGLPTLFEVGPADVRRELVKFATKEKFGDLARDFFARLTQKNLEYYLSRALPDHVKPGRAMDTIAKHVEFGTALERHCREASEIVEVFAGGWFSKNNYHGKLTPESAQAFADYSLKKMRDELRARRGGDA